MARGWAGCAAPLALYQRQGQGENDRYDYGALPSLSPSLLARSPVGWPLLNLMIVRGRLIQFSIS